MPDLFNDADERKVLVDDVAARKGVAAWVVEKDLWVCWTLARLLEIPDLPGVTFKGGTSLSKVHGLVDRFSEDIDLTFSRDGWGFEGDRDPLNETLSWKKRQGLVDEIAARSTEVVREVVVPGLRAACAPLQPGDWTVEISNEDPQAVLFRFPQPSSTFSYGLPIVKVEFGARGEPWPTARRRVRPFVEEFHANLASSAIAEVSTLEAERTFWEKATLLHALHHGSLAKPDKKLERLSRHLYDLHRMWHRDDLRARILADKSLLDAVVRNKRTFFREGKARYELLDDYTLNATPHEVLKLSLESDYGDMASMFFPGTPVPKFAELLATLGEIDEAVARWGTG
ncbi:MAG: nucleotidyl transferase AbiEii/AbiGii toxin family protein [Myxococcota bacterium]